MLKKIALTYASSFLLTISCCVAQASFKCYTTPKTKANWAIGTRTGVSREYNISYFQSELNSKIRSWTQQLFLQRDLGKHFMLELQCMHQSSWRDMIANTPPIATQTYQSVILKSHRLHTNMILHYLVPTSTEKIKAGIGAGLGITTSRDLLEKIYTESGQSLQSANITYPIESPNIIVAATGSYWLKRRISLNGQASYSNLPTAGLSHVSINVGLEYSL